MDFIRFREHVMGEPTVKVTRYACELNDAPNSQHHNIPLLFFIALRINISTQDHVREESKDDKGAIKKRSTARQRIKDVMKYLTDKVFSTGNNYDLLINGVQLLHCLTVTITSVKVMEVMLNDQLLM